MNYILASFIIIVFSIIGVITPLKNAVSNVVIPIQFGLSTSASGIKEYLDFFNGFNRVRSENIQLLQEKHNLTEKLVELKLLSQENDLLKKQLALHESNHTDVSESILAQVMTNADDIDESTLIADVGSSSGVRSGDMVVIGNNLIGKIKSVEYSRSVIELITSPNLSFTVYDLDSNQLTQGLVKGKHGSFLSLQRVSVNEPLNIGDFLLTSGKDGIFKPNFVVGKITHISEDPSQPLKSADVQTLIDFSKVTKVFIILQSTKFDN